MKILCGVQPCLLTAHIRRNKLSVLLSLLSVLSVPLLLTLSLRQSVLSKTFCSHFSLRTLRLCGANFCYDTPESVNFGFLAFFSVFGFYPALAGWLGFLMEKKLKYESIILWNINSFIETL
jgi:hypothetical protein